MATEYCVLGALKATAMWIAEKQPLFRPRINNGTSSYEASEQRKSPLRASHWPQRLRLIPLYEATENISDHLARDACPSEGCCNYD